MLDTTAHPTTNTPVMQRVKGRALAHFEGGRLVDLHQSGSAKAMLPKVHSPTPEVVFLNTSGGLTAGDRLEYTLRAGDGCHIIGTTQTAERAYLARGGDAFVSVELEAGAGGNLEWLPQETILFEGARLRRETTATVARDARLLMCETVVLGRAAMGETLENVNLLDRRRVLRDGALEWLEPVALTREALGAGCAVLDGARAFATIALFDQGAQDRVDAVRRVDMDGVRAGVSGWNGKLVVRAMAADGYPLRKYVARVLNEVRRAALPRVWQI